MTSFPNDPAQEYTSPEDRGKCGFCGGEEGGYCKQDDQGKWQPACWSCIKPTPLPPQKREPVGTVFHEDLDTEEKIVKKKDKSPGMAPSTYRPKVA